MSANILKFDKTTLCFHVGTNTTFRRFGSGLRPGDCRICAAGTGPGARWIYDGEITNIQIFEFCKIPNSLRRIHHRFCAYAPLVDQMRKHYKNFHSAEIVQVVSFKVDFSRENPDLPF